MKRKLLMLLYLFSLSCFSPALVSCQQDKGEMAFSSYGDAISFHIKKEERTGSNTWNVYYTLRGESEEEVSFSESISWNTSSSSSYEAGFGTNKVISDYVTYVHNQDLSFLRFTCKKPFGRQLIFTLSVVEAPSVKGILTIDYSRKLLSKGSVDINTTYLSEGDSLSYKYNYPVYSIGSKGSKVNGTFSMNPLHDGYSLLESFGPQLGEYPFENCSDYSDYFPCMYQGEYIETVRDLLVAICDQLDNLLYDFINGSAFSQSQLVDILSYEWIGGDNHAFYNCFVTNYIQEFEDWVNDGSNQNDDRGLIGFVGKWVSSSESTETLMCNIGLDITTVN